MELSRVAVQLQYTYVMNQTTKFRTNHVQTNDTEIPVYGVSSTAAYFDRGVSSVSCRCCYAIKIGSMQLQLLRIHAVLKNNTPAM